MILPLSPPTERRDEKKAALAARTTAKVERRLLPVLFLLYIGSFVDRTNVSIARCR